MIKIPSIGLEFDNIKDVIKLEQTAIDYIKGLERWNQIHFQVPESITEIDKMTTYKVGFLLEFLKVIYPNKKIYELQSIIRHKYQVFLSDRQLSRHYKRYTENRES